MSIVGGLRTLATGHVGPVSEEQLRRARNAFRLLDDDHRRSLVDRLKEKSVNFRRMQEEVSANASYLFVGLAFIIGADVAMLIPARGGQAAPWFKGGIIAILFGAVILVMFLSAKKSRRVHDYEPGHMAERELRWQGLGVEEDLYRFEHDGGRLHRRDVRQDVGWTALACAGPCFVIGIVLSACGVFFF